MDIPSMQACGQTNGVGPDMILAWPGWKQSDIVMEVDTGRLETSRFKKCYANCILLYFPSTEFKSAFNVYPYWHGGGAAGLSCTELSIWEFPFWRGVCWQGWTSIWYCEKGMPQKDTLDNLRTPVCFRILSPSFTSVSIFSVSCYSIVSISAVGQTPVCSCHVFSHKTLLVSWFPICSYFFMPRWHT